MADPISNSPFSSVDVAQQLAQAQDLGAALKKGSHVTGTTAALSAAAAAGASDADAIAISPSRKTVAPDLSHSDAPMLPNPTGKSAPAREVLQVVANPLAAMGTGLFAAMQVMTRARQNDITLGMKIKSEMGANQVQAKKDELAHKEDEIAGQRASAVTKFAGAIAGTAASGLMAYKGAQSEIAQDTREPKAAQANNINVSRAARQSEADAGQSPAGAKAAEVMLKHRAKAEKVVQAKSHEKALAASDAEASSQAQKAAEKAKQDDATGIQAADSTVKGSMFRAMSVNISGSVTGFTDVFDKLLGGQRAADDAAVDQKGDAIKGQIAQNNTDSAGAFLDDAKEKRKNTQQALMAHIQLVADAGAKASGM